MIHSQFELAAKLIKKSHSILVGTGAGMGKDSGLPDFRGNEGFWNYYPPYRGKFNFYQCANPQFLAQQPNLFWGFYGSRLQMYRRAVPHQGYSILKQFQQIHNKQIFTVTSNVDGLHKKAGFSEQNIYEVHGSIHHLQCQNDSCKGIIENNFQPRIDYGAMRCQNLPSCGQCKKPMRPNIFMFDDYFWDQTRSNKQQKHLNNFLRSSLNKGKKICMIQIGCGQGIPTIRNILDQAYSKNKQNCYIRINPDNDSEYEKKSQQKDRFIHIRGSAKICLKNIKEKYYKL